MTVGQYEMASMAKSRRQIVSDKLVLYGALLVISLFAFFPIYWMLVTSLTPAKEVFAFPPRLFPSSLTLDYYRDFFNKPELIRFFRNSVLVSSVTAVGSIIISSYAAYSFSKFRYWGRKSLMFLVLSAQMFPQALLLIALYLMFDSLGLLNSYWAVILAFTTFTLPLCIWMLKSYFDGIPNDLIEAAKVDGANQFQIIHRVLLPIAAPALVSTGLFAFIRGWNDFIYALTLAGPEKMTLPPGLVLFYTGEFQTAWPNLMAASLIVSLPIVVGFLIMQRYIVGGVTAGAVKG
ncbi:carbohydrate ABC transporter permease [Aggregatilinea lenta]|uniref:carbohydrate ABC transporter permease n=1 Tax=Aggregatilinea lenta TaxID=913108 RepID=UPI000E5B2125|nr:carbohydrate ABC transporter permease [Aggregatilinea lenta]